MASGTSLIELKEVSKTYTLGDSLTRALNNVSLRINKGEFIAIIGPSGSGKSTLMHVGSLLDTPTAGQVFFENVDTTNFSENELAAIRNQKIGFVFQQFNLLPRTSAFENVQLPLIYSHQSRTIRTKMAQEILEKVGLADKLKNTPAQLSGGQQQRVAIARALINNPQVIFADEPTGNLDSKSGDEIMELLSQLHTEGKTIIVVTHEAEIAEFAKRIITMRDGKIIADTTKKKSHKGMLKNKKKAH